MQSRLILNLSFCSLMTRRILLILLILLTAGGAWLYGNRARAPLQDTNLADVGRRLGIHIFAPTSLPAGFQIQADNLFVYDNVALSYFITPPSSTASVVISQKPTSIESSPSEGRTRLLSKGWTIEAFAMEGFSGYVGRSPSGSQTYFLLRNAQSDLTVYADGSIDYGLLTSIVRSLR